MCTLQIRLGDELDEDRAIRKVCERAVELREDLRQEFVRKGNVEERNEIVGAVRVHFDRSERLSSGDDVIFSLRR